MRSLKITLAYDGTNYNGWQIQKNGTSIQEELEKGFEKVTGEFRRITASGRTDSGVHALAQVCSVATNSEIECKHFVRALNAETPFDISILNVQPAPDGFHAIHDAIRKRYRYVIQNGRILDVFGRRFAWFIPRPLDFEPMKRATELLVGEHDFASFQTTGSERKTTVRTVYDLTIEQEIRNGFVYYVLEVEANGFLYNMVRNIVGTVVEIGQGKYSPEKIPEIVAAKDRRAAGQTAAPEGLFLKEVTYENSDA